MLDVDEDGNRPPVPGDSLIFVAGRPPIYGRQRLYFLDKKLSERSKLAPPRMKQSGVANLTTVTMEKQHDAA